MASMRERSYKVDVEKLDALSRVYSSVHIASKLKVSKQRWSMYKLGKNDMPESILDALCVEFNLNKDDLALA